MKFVNIFVKFAKVVKSKTEDHNKLSASLLAMGAASPFGLQRSTVILATIPTFFTDGVDLLSKLVLLIGGGLAVWGVINLLEGYGNDNPGAKSQGMKQFMAGAGVAMIGIILIPKLTELFA